MLHTSCGIFKVSDTIVGGVNFNSADTYNAIDVGKSYDFKTRGIRFGFLSMFPVVLEVAPSA